MIFNNSIYGSLNNFESILKNDRLELPINVIRVMRNIFDFYNWLDDNECDINIKKLSIDFYNALQNNLKISISDNFDLKIAYEFNDQIKFVIEEYLKENLNVKNFVYYPIISFIYAIHYHIFDHGFYILDLFINLSYKIFVKNSSSIIIYDLREIKKEKNLKTINDLKNIEEFDSIVSSFIFKYMGVSKIIDMDFASLYPKYLNKEVSKTIDEVSKIIDMDVASFYPKYLNKEAIESHKSTFSLKSFRFEEILDYIFSNPIIYENYEKNIKKYKQLILFIFKYKIELVEKYLDSHKNLKKLYLEHKFLE